MAVRRKYTRKQLSHRHYLKSSTTDNDNQPTRTDTRIHIIYIYFRMAFVLSFFAELWLFTIAQPYNHIRMNCSSRNYSTLTRSFVRWRTHAQLNARNYSAYHRRSVNWIWFNLIKMTDIKFNHSFFIYLLSLECHSYCIRIVW